jgi:K+-sensing histidine kinase KdpD
MKTLSKLQRYGLATISCGATLAVAWPIDAPSSCFLLAVTVSSLFGGLGPTLLSIGLSALAFDYFFLQRTLPPAVEPGHILAICSLPGSDFADHWVDGDKTAR